MIKIVGIEDILAENLEYMYVLYETLLEYEKDGCPVVFAKYKEESSDSFYITALTGKNKVIDLEGINPDTDPVDGYYYLVEICPAYPSRMDELCQSMHDRSIADMMEVERYKRNYTPISVI